MKDALLCVNHFECVSRWLTLHATFLRKIHECRKQKSVKNNVDQIQAKEQCLYSCKFKDSSNRGDLKWLLKHSPLPCLIIDQRFIIFYIYTSLAKVLKRLLKYATLMFADTLISFVVEIISNKEYTSLLFRTKSIINCDMLLRYIKKICQTVLLFSESSAKNC